MASSMNANPFSAHHQTPYSEKLSQKVLDSLRTLNRSLHAMESNMAVIEQNLDSDDEFLQQAEQIRRPKKLNGFAPSWQLRRESVLQVLESTDDETTEDGEGDGSRTPSPRLMSYSMKSRATLQEQESRAQSDDLKELLLKLVRRSAAAGVTFEGEMAEELQSALCLDSDTAIALFGTWSPSMTFPGLRVNAFAPPKSAQRSPSKFDKPSSALDIISSDDEKSTEQLSRSSRSREDTESRHPNIASLVNNGGITTPIIVLPETFGGNACPSEDPAASCYDFPQGEMQIDSVEARTKNMPSPRFVPEIQVPLGVEFGYTELPPLPLSEYPGMDEDTIDEWRDDYDPGYVLVQISEEEFMLLEEEAAEAAQRKALAKQIRDQLVEWQKENEHLSSPAKCTSMDQGLEDDIAAVEAALASSSSAYISNHDTFGGTPTLENHSMISDLTHEGFPVNEGGTPKFKEATGYGDTMEEEDDAGTSAPNVLDKFELKIIYQKGRTGFEESKHFNPPLNEIIAGRYRVREFLGQAAFSTALQCVDLNSNPDHPKHVCLKVIKNNKDFFDQSLDEIKLLTYINKKSVNPDRYHILQMFDYFYFKEHLFIVSELLRENLYEFGKYIRENNEEPYFTLPRLQKIMLQCLEALAFINRLNLIHCDIKPENIVIKSYSRVEIKVIDFGSSCYTTDHLTSYIQSRSYRAPEVVLGLPYGQKIDVWSLGCVLAEMLTGYVLFQNDSIQTMLARIQGVLEPFPEHMLEHGRDVPKYFTSNNLLYERIDDGEGGSGGFLLIYPKKTSLRHRLHSDDPKFLDFVAKTLAIDPALRPTAEEALRHPWILDGLKYSPEDIAYCPRN